MTGKPYSRYFFFSTFSQQINISSSSPIESVDWTILAMAECTEGPAHPDQGFEENRAVADVYNLLDYC